MYALPRTFVIACSLLLLAGGATNPHAAVGDHQYSWGIDANAQSALDGSGNLAVAGAFFSPLDLGGGVMTPVNFLGGDIFVARFDDNGAHLWSTQFTPTGFGATVEAVGTGPSGEVFVVGNLQNGDIDFGGGVLTTGGSINAMYVAAFDANGTHLWSRTAGRGSFTGIAADATGTYLCGRSFDGVDFGGGLLTSAGDSDLFLARLDLAGVHQWTKLLGDANAQSAVALDVDGSGNVVMAAANEGTVDFGGGALTPSGTAGLVLVKYDTTGAHQWSQLIDGRFTAGAGVGWQMSIDVNAAGDFVVGGEMQNSVDFGGGVLTSTGNSDMFVARYDGAGTHVWSQIFGGSSSEIAHGVAFDSSGNVAVSGTFLSSNVSFGGASFSPGGFGSDFYAALYDANGIHQWSASYGGGGQYFLQVDCDPSDNLVLRGSGGGGVDFGGGALANANFFVAELGGATTVTAAAPSAGLKLLPNVPNPFNPSTTIRFELGVEAKVEVTVFDTRGRRVRSLLRSQLEAGPHALRWNGEADDGSSVASGVYVVRVRSDEELRNQSVTLVK